MAWGQTSRPKTNRRGLEASARLALFILKQFKNRVRKINEENQKKLERVELEQSLRLSELKAIKAQLNPHFIFNALNSIQDYIIMNEKELASNYLGKFADLFLNQTVR